MAKASNPRKQLNVRSNEAYGLAHEIALKEGRSATDVVVKALRRYATQKPELGSQLPEAMIAENERIIDDAVKKLWGGEDPPVGQTSNHDELYDENGL
jgi:hypothetical protein